MRLIALLEEALLLVLYPLVALLEAPFLYLGMPVTACAALLSSLESSLVYLSRTTQQTFVLLLNAGVI